MSVPFFSVLVSLFSSRHSRVVFIQDSKMFSNVFWIASSPSNSLKWNPLIVVLLELKMLFCLNTILIPPHSFSNSPCWDVFEKSFITGVHGFPAPVHSPPVGGDWSAVHASPVGCAMFLKSHRA